MYICIYETCARSALLAVNAILFYFVATMKFLVYVLTALGINKYAIILFDISKQCLY